MYGHHAGVHFGTQPHDDALGVVVHLCARGRPVSLLLGPERVVGDVAQGFVDLADAVQLENREICGHHEKVARRCDSQFSDGVAVLQGVLTTAEEQLAVRNARPRARLLPQVCDVSCGAQ
jgi:hypothetical protein